MPYWSVQKLPIILYQRIQQLINAFDQLDWFSIKADGLGDLYEGLLEKNATETKSGAGQYFTLRPLINSIVRCVQPQPNEVIQGVGLVFIVVYTIIEY